MYTTKALSLKHAIDSFFYNRNYIDRHNNTESWLVYSEIKDNTLRITLKEEAQAQVIEIPIPFTERNLDFITHNNILRAAGKYLIISETGEETLIDFMDLVHSLFCDDTNVISKYFSKKDSFLSKLYYGHKNNNLSTIIYNVQKTINDVVTSMPLHNTDMNTWAMNRRLSIIDSKFGGFSTPIAKLDYQIEKSKKYFSRGYTSIGLPDGVLADHNYILTETLRKTIPFGFHFHNPQRNLYQTLGMRGEELPLIRSNTMERLANEGITRKGWNLFTIFLDVPDVWEDQIMVDVSLCDKGVTYEKRVQCFGNVLVKQGSSVEKGDILAINKDGEKQVLRLNADKILVKSVTETNVIIGGAPEKAFDIVLSYTRFIKEGTKITNLAANKGVVRVAELGYAIDPRTGIHRKIDVIVACKAVEKRRNNTQILEAIYNNLTNDKGLVVDDFIKPTMIEVENLLEEKGFPRTAQWECHTYAGVHKAVAGTVFWGVTMDVEDMVWDKGDTTVTNNRGLRTAGLKVSTVEFRAIRTRFGKNNPITDEILSYAQGADDIKELMKALRSIKGVPLPNQTIIPCHKVKPLLQKNGVMVSCEEIVGSIVDEFYMPEGFTMALPVSFQTILDKKGDVIYTGIPIAEGVMHNEERRFNINTIYIPATSLRRCWKHSCGRYGLSEVGNIINTLVVLCQKHINTPEDSRVLTLLYSTINNYFNKISNFLSTKAGNVSLYGMAVRYPYSVKGVAVLSNDLPRNVVQINQSMAKDLRVSEGDVVLVERFPCLGFMSIRPQKVTITKDPRCQYTIRVSGNSLGSLSLDFDGDNVYIASMHTKEAKALLQKEWANPNKSCYDAIKELNTKMGKPHFASLTLQDYNIAALPLLTVDEHASIVAKATGVKSHTGPVVALAYNIMRIMENSDIKENQKVNVAIEVFLDKVANSVFKQKHGIKSLHEVVTDAICTADIETLVAEGFSRSTSTMVCDLIKRKAKEVGINDLVWYHSVTKPMGTTIINKIVRTQNKVYYASRANLVGVSLLESLDAEAVDIPSRIFKKVMKAGPATTKLDEDYDESMLKKLNTEWTKDLYNSYSTVINNMFFK